MSSRRVVVGATLALAGAIALAGCALWGAREPERWRGLFLIFAIAGLLQSRGVRAVDQVPWLGSVPVLGALFRSTAYQNDESDLVIIVTPRLVAPAAPGQTLASPLDSRLPANDVDFFLNGQMEVKKRYNDYVNSGGDIKGPYGHIIAPDVRLSAPAVVTDQPVLRTKN